MRFALVLVGPLALAGCSGEVTRWLDSAPFDGAASAILAISDDDGFHAMVYDLRDDIVLRPTVTIREHGQVEALIYDSTLEALGIEDGLLEPDNDGQPLPPADRHFITNVDLDEASPWRMTPAPSAALSKLRGHWARTNPCEALSIERIGLDTDLAVAGIEEIAEGVVWVATERRGEMFVYDGTLTRAEVRPNDINVAEMAFANDYLWVASALPALLYRGRPNGTVLELEVVTATLAERAVSRVEVAPNETAIVIDKWSAVFRAGERAPLFEFGVTLATDDTALFVDNDQIVAGTARSKALWRSTADGETSIATPNGAGVDDIEFIDGIGLVVGTVLPTLYTLDGDDLTPLTTIEFPPSRSVVRFHGGMLIGSSAGGLYRYANGRTCRTTNSDGEDLEIVTTFADSALFAPTSAKDRLRIGGPTPLTLVTLP